MKRGYRGAAKCGAKGGHQWTEPPKDASRVGGGGNPGKSQSGCVLVGGGGKKGRRPEKEQRGRCISLATEPTSGIPFYNKDYERARPCPLKLPRAGGRRAKGEVPTPPNRRVPGVPKACQPPARTLLGVGWILGASDSGPTSSCHGY